MKKLVVMLCSLVLCISLCACNNSNKDGMDSYVGNTYTGTSPWGESLSVTINSCDKSSVEFTIEEAIGSDIKAKKDYEGDLLDDNSLVIHNNSEIKGDNAHIQYEYSRKLEFKDGEILVTYVDGEAIDKSSKGGKSFNQVKSLSDKEKTVELKLDEK